MDFKQKYNRETWLSFLKDNFLPEDFFEDEKTISVVEKLDFTQTVTKLGEVPSLELTIFEIKHKSTNDARVGLSKEAFRIVCNYTMHNRALVLFVPQNNNDFYRFSFIEFTPVVNEKGKLKRNYSNPRRYSFILGRDAKTKTPEQYLIGKKRVKDVTDLKSRFSVEVLTKEFFNELFAWYDKWAINEVAFPVGCKANVELKQGGQNRIHLIRLITRLIFVWFIKQKKLVPEWIFEKSELSKILKTFKADSLSEGNYYNGIIQNLFFATLNKPINEREFAKEEAGERKEDYGIKTKYRDDIKNSFFAINHDDFISRFELVPFLNGGLFECLDNFDDRAYIDGFSRERKRRAFVPNALFWGDGERTGIFELFNTYNFTIEENTPQDVDVALDPELLGKAFENLLGTFNEETKEAARKVTGSFYTPREIVNYMVDSSLKEYFKNFLKDDKEVDSKLEDLFSYQTEGHKFSDSQVTILISVINTGKILDPACGSGAFPMGILQRLVFILGKLDSDNTLWSNAQREKAVEDTAEAFKIGDKAKRDERLKEISDIFQQNTDDYGRKLFLIENCIYGIDIQPIAIQISKLRFFISLIVDQNKGNDKSDNYGIRPLPNLETKFVAANTLIGVKREQGVLADPQIEVKQNELLTIRHRHFNARNAKEKTELRKADKKLSEDLAKLMKNDGFCNSKDAEQMAEWNPYDQNRPAGFFDPEWMFGVKDGFDVVIGNPPYVAITQILQDDRRLFEKTYRYARGRFNLFYLFLEISSKFNRRNGLSSFIVPDRIMLNTQCGNLRNFLITEQTMIEIVAFDDSVFKSAVVDSVILLFKNSESTIDFVSVKNKINISEFPNSIKYSIPINYFLDSPSHQFDLSYDVRNVNIINKICSVSIPLGSIAEIRDGIIQGKVANELFLEKKLDNDSKKLLFGENVNRFVINYHNNWVNYKPEEMMALELNRRGEARHGLWMRTPVIFEREKILTRQTADEIIATLDTNKYYYANTLHGTTITDNNYDVKYVLGILNSKLITWYYRTTTMEEGKVFAQIKIELLKILPIYKAKKGQQTQIITIVDKILSAKQTNPNADTSDLEMEIDKMVYTLYGLTEDEIKVAEGKNG